MTAELLLGLDLGTTFAKATVVTADDGVERSHGRARTPWRPVGTGAEMDPDALVDAAASAARRALAGAPAGRVTAVGVTSMAETGALLDGEGRPVVPMIAWHDTRGDDEAEDLAAALGRDRFVETTGLPATRLCTLSKYRWMRSHLPEAKRGGRWLNVAEWMLRSLGGEQVAELSLSSRTGFLDLAGGAWWDDAMAWAEAPSGFLPEPVEAGTPAGRLTRVLPEADGATLTVSGHDHPCACVGAGATGPGDVFDSCGTAEAVFRPVAPPTPPDAIHRAVDGGVTVGWHAVPGQQGLMAGFASGLALQRFLDLLDPHGRNRDALDAAAMGVPPGSEGVLVRDITHDRAAVEGIPWSATPGHLWRAALEAVARHAADALATIESVAGPTGRLVVTGGWARNAAVRAVKRAAIGEFEEPDVDEAGARGAALLAGVAAGIYGGVDDLPPVRWRDPGAD
jgi:sugar (pentulose or hexulose) kinase